MTRSLARELGPRGIGVTVVAPGIMRCEATEYVPAERHRLYETGRAVPGPQRPGGHRRHRGLSAHAGSAGAHRAGAAGQRGVRLHMSAITTSTAAGLSYLARRRGEGTPVVLLHGIGSNAQSFVPLMRGARSARIPVVAWDAPGYGDFAAAAGANGRMPRDYAAALNRLLAELDISRCILIGHSLGALIAARLGGGLAQSRRHAVSALAGARLRCRPQRRRCRPAVAAPARRTRPAGARRHFAAARAPGLLADPAGRPDVLRAVERAMAAVRRPGYDQAGAHARGRPPARGRGKQVAVPTAVWVGAQDRITPPANARQVFDVAAATGTAGLCARSRTPATRLCQERPAEVASAIARTRRQQGQPACLRRRRRNVARRAGPISRRRCSARCG